MAHDVFISYASKDINTVKAIVHYLEEEKIRCWYADRDIPAGEDWAAAIMDALGTAKLFVLVFTDFSNESRQVLREVNTAVNNGIPIIPFKLTEKDPTGGMMYYLSTVHWLDAMDEALEKSINKLYKTVSGLLDKQDSHSKKPSNKTATDNDTPEKKDQKKWEAYFSSARTANEGSRKFYKYPDGKTPTKYYMGKLLGEGASCIAYDAISEDGIPVVAKQFCPIGGLSSAEYEQKKDEYLKVCENQLKLLRNCGTGNATSGIFDICRDEYGFIWTIARKVYGENFTQACKRYPLSARVKWVENIAEGMAAFHQAGYLLIDLKPDNVLLIDSPGVHGINFFDLDSFILKNDLEKCRAENKQIYISSTENYSAPEAIGEVDLNRISEKCDRFSVGALLYYAVFSCEPSDLNFKANRSFDFSAIKELDKDSNELITAFLRRTMTTEPERRYNSDEELLAALKKITKHLASGEPELYSNVPYPSKQFVGRENELSLLTNMVNAEVSPVFISGQSGMGKTELAFAFAQKNSGKMRFHYVPFNKDVDKMLIALPFTDLGHGSDEEKAAVARACLSKLDRNTVILIDAMDFDSPEEMSEFLKSEEFQSLKNLPVTLFITTICTNTESQRTVHVGALSNEDIMSHMHIFAPDLEKDTASKLVALFDSHTLGLEIVARNIGNGNILAENVLKKIKPEMSITDKLSDIFSSIKFSKAEQELLTFIHIIPDEGISAITLEVAAPDSDAALAKLISGGWIRDCNQDNRFRLHNIVRKVILNSGKIPATQISLDPFITRLRQSELDSDEINEIFANYVRSPKGSVTKQASAALKYSSIAAICAIVLTAAAFFCIRMVDYLGTPKLKNYEYTLCDEYLGENSIDGKKHYSYSGKVADKYLYRTDVYNISLKSLPDEKMMVNLTLTPSEDISEEDSSANAEVINNRLNILTEGDYYSNINTDGSISIAFPYEKLSSQEIDVDSSIRIALSSKGITSIIETKGATYRVIDEIAKDELISCTVCESDEIIQAVGLTEIDTIKNPYGLIFKVNKDVADRIGSYINDGINIYLGQVCRISYCTAMHDNIVKLSDDEIGIIDTQNWDSKTFYSCVAENYAGECLSCEYSFTYEIIPYTKWEDPDEIGLPGKNQVSIADVPENRVFAEYSTYIDNMHTEEELYDVRKTIINRLDTIGHPYALGQDCWGDGALHLMMCADRLNYFWLSMLSASDSDFYIISENGERYNFSYGAEYDRQISREQEVGSASFALNFLFTNFDKIGSAYDYNKILKLTENNAEKFYLMYRYFPVASGQVSVNDDGFLFTFNKCEIGINDTFTDDNVYILDLVAAVFTEDCRYSCVSYKLTDDSEFGAAVFGKAAEDAKKIAKEISETINAGCLSNDFYQIAIALRLDSTDNNYMDTSIQQFSEFVSKFRAVHPEISHILCFWSVDGKNGEKISWGSYGQDTELGNIITYYSQTNEPYYQPEEVKAALDKYMSDSVGEWNYTYMYY